MTGLALNGRPRNGRPSGAAPAPPPNPSRTLFQAVQGTRMSASEIYARWRYRLIPDHVLGEILSKNWIDNAIPVVILALAIAFFAAVIPDFFSVSGLTDNARQLGELMLVVLGMTIVMLAGGIDLSVGSNFALTTFLSLGMFNALGWPVPVVIALGLLTGALVGLVNGIL